MPSFRVALQSKSCLLGTFVSFNDPYSAQVLARCGFDWLMIDMEHSPLSAQEITSMVHSTVAASAGSCCPIVRIPSHGVEWIKWALDSGASGIIVPMVNNKQEVDAVLKRALYPPAGQRSFGPFRAPFADMAGSLDMAEYKRKTAPTVAIMPMIESVEAVENAEEIVGAQGVDGIFIGPVDLRHSLGFEGPEGDEDAYLAALQRVLDVGKKFGKAIGILGTQESVPRLVQMGFSFIMLAGGDAGILAEAASAKLKASRQSIG
ncbi:5-keto-4-deoxy-D-glucarate aldolase [Cladophialophora carrionii]|uniref:5-keto-4-deoxy-D-glucarate aldolase n=1 Tax=Cladophialophora carrionii TaxID=86049 RepID=A0A1C1CZ62_9EURO|nr:5-keto-4-deoxy-D-glucarate aldolase [Cladophialophora carrionii]